MKECPFCAGQVSVENVELGVRITLVGSKIKIIGYNQMGWKKEARFDISFCPMCGRAVNECKELEREE